MEIGVFDVALFGFLAGILGDKDEEHRLVFYDTLAKLKASLGDVKKIAAWLTETLYIASSEAFTIDACRVLVDNFIKMCVPQKFFGRGGATMKFKFDPCFKTAEAVTRNLQKI